MLPRLLTTLALGLAIFAAALWLFIINNKPGLGDTDPSYILRTNVEPITSIEVFEKWYTPEQRSMEITDKDTLNAFRDAMREADSTAEYSGGVPIALKYYQCIDIHFLSGEIMRIALSTTPDGSHTLFDHNHYVHIPATDLHPFLTQLHQQHNILELE